MPAATGFTISWGKKAGEEGVLTGDLSSQLRLQALDLREQALAQHLLLLLGGSSCQHGSGQVAALLAGHHS